MDWSKCIYYDSTSPSGLRWLVDIPVADSKAIKFHRGSVAGSLHKTQGYYYVTYKGVIQGAHRVIAVLHGLNIEKGTYIDHIDGNRVNNSIGNLRVVTPKLSSRNIKMKESNKSGVTGVSRRFKRYKNGNIFYSYVASYVAVDGTAHTKWFSVNKLGEDGAKSAAIKYREAMIRELNRHGEGYTERHGK